MPQPIGHGLHQHRFIERQAQPPRLFGGLVHGEGVVAVDPDAVDAVPRRARDDSVTAILLRH